MKSCPTCNRTYPDDTQAFCLVDGAVLCAPYEPQTSQPYQSANKVEPPPTEVFQPTIKITNPIHGQPTQPNFIPPAVQREQSYKGDSKRKLLFGLLVFLILANGIIIGMSWNRWFGGNNSSAKQSNSAVTNVNTTTRTPPGQNSSPISSPTLQSTPFPQTTPALAKKVDVTGNWSGTFARREAVLYINSQEGNSFSGILKNSKGAIVAVSGRVDPDTRQVVIQETRIIEGVKEGPEWILGTDTGTLSADGRRMSGSGKDKAGHVYAWSFSK